MAGGDVTQSSPGMVHKRCRNQTPNLNIKKKFICLNIKYLFFFVSSVENMFLFFYLFFAQCPNFIGTVNMFLPLMIETCSGQSSPFAAAQKLL